MTKLVIRSRKPIAKLVRFIFHDCITECDGCVDINNVENRGLESTFTALNNIYDNETSGFSSTNMSRADFYAIAGIVRGFTLVVGQIIL